MLVLLVAAAMVVYVMSGDVRGTRRGMIERVASYVPLHSVKIVIVAWQILTQVRTIFLDRSATEYSRRQDLRLVVQRGRSASCKRRGRPP